MEVTFGKDQQPVVDVVAVATPVADVKVEAINTVATPIPQTAAVVTMPKPGPLARGNSLQLGDELPDFKDLIIPRVNIGQNIGDLGANFEPGAIVYNQELPLFIPGKINEKTKVVERTPTAPVILTVLGFRPTRYCEKVEGGGKGLIVATEDDVRAAGGTLDYSEWKLKAKDGMKRFEPFADALVLIARPEICKDDGTVFIYPVEESQYTLALWGMRGTAYTAAAKRVFFTKRSMGCLREGGYPSWSFAVSTRMDSYPGGHSAWVPVCLPNKKNTPAFIELVKSVIGG